MAYSSQHAGSEEKPIVGVSCSLEFRVIYDSWFNKVLRWIRVMGGPSADCEDLVQDVFIVVHRRLHAFDGKNLSAWLYQIARRRVRDFRRLMWVKHSLFLNMPLSDNLTTSSASPADTVETQQEHDALEQLFRQLNETERATIVLFEVDGRNGEEIAKIQGVPLNTVWARIYRARKKLRAGKAQRSVRGTGFARSEEQTAYLPRAAAPASLRCDRASQPRGSAST
jgi:RNA polymerase sigma-70 factor (ECF subfamily)